MRCCTRIHGGPEVRARNEYILFGGNIRGRQRPCAGGLSARSDAGRWQVFLRRRLQCLPSGSDLIRLDDDCDLQQEIYEKRERARPCGTHPHEVLSCHVPALHIRHAALPADQQCRGVVDCDGASHAFHRSARLSISHSESH